MFSPYYWHNHRLKVTLGFINKFWWRFVPGVIIKVRWPNGDIIVTEDHPLWDWTVGPSRYIIESADPNEHYRPWLEQNVGKQGWDWDWTLMDNDISQNTLTIKFRKGKEKYATIAALRWA